MHAGCICGKKKKKTGMFTRGILVLVTKSILVTER